MKINLLKCYKNFKIHKQKPKKKKKKPKHRINHKRKASLPIKTPNNPKNFNNVKPPSN